MLSCTSEEKRLKWQNISEESRNFIYFRQKTLAIGGSPRIMKAVSKAGHSGQACHRVLNTDVRILC